eukprot:TRINITY_DN10704_c3_g1_i1.p1 TRINITY_DN10704_c3_g1~~TRINITY_DN10704_c3_g1_i1.p1  ORF type:complete len:392 (+),score=28.86 TRINITY_DN10704_c3_g1_i1:29-1204(+)
MKQKIPRKGMMSVPGGRSKRGLALLRRHEILRPERSIALKRCTMCGCRRRIGRWWMPPTDSKCEQEEECQGKEIWYCEPCWDQWLVVYKQWFSQDDWSAVDNGISGTSSSSTSKASSSSSSSEPSNSSSSSAARTKRARRPFSSLSESELSHFDFVEIGTSNYHTFTQAVASMPNGKPYAWMYLPEWKDLSEVKGLAVDMKRRYLDQLPDLPNVEKCRAAISEHGEYQRMFHVRVSDVERWERIFASRGSKRGYRAIRLARGCSKLGRHNVLWKALGLVGLSHLVRVRRIRTMTTQELFERHKIGSIGVLALDCEGHDCAILKGLINACQGRRKWYPEWIIFETNGMNDENFGQGTERSTIQALIDCGYEVYYGGGYRETWTRDTVLRRTW